jgi:transcriptional regulator with XRE-family HTH domain
MLANRVCVAFMSDADIYRLLGRNIAAHRAARKLTQAQVAERLGLTRASLANIETGRQRAMLHHIYEIADALGLESILDLIPGRRPKSWRPPGRPTQSSTGGQAAMKFTGDTLTAVEKAQVEGLISQALRVKTERRR